jgi:hypothetical protein
VNSESEGEAKERRAAVVELLARGLVRLALRNLSNPVGIDLISSATQSVYAPDGPTMPNGDAEERDAKRGPAAEPGRDARRRRSE